MKMRVIGAKLGTAFLLIAPLACSPSPQVTSPESAELAAGGDAPNPHQAADASGVAGSNDAGDVVCTLTVAVPKFVMLSPYWLYVDGRIVAFRDVSEVSYMQVESPDTVIWVDLQGNMVGEVDKKTRRVLSAKEGGLEKIDVRLPPGQHTVELAVLSDYVEGIEPGERFPLKFRRKTVTIEANKMREVQVDPPLMRIPSATEGSIDPLPVVREDEFLNDLEKELIAKITATLDDPVYAALQKVTSDMEFKRVRPRGSTIYVALPEKHGGGRELDARQLRLIVAYLKQQHWGWLPDRYTALKNDPDGPARFERLKHAVTHRRDLIDGLNYIAKKLEQIDRADPVPASSEDDVSDVE